MRGEAEQLGTHSDGALSQDLLRFLLRNPKGVLRL